MSCTSTTLESAIAPEVDRPEATVSNNVTALMRTDHVVKGRRGRYGGAVMTTRCAVNALLGCVLDRPKGAPIGDFVDSIRALQFLDARALILHNTTLTEKRAAAARFVVGLSILHRIDDFGGALESLIDDLRTGALDAWAGDAAPWITIDIVGCGFAQIAIDRKIGDDAAIVQFGEQQSQEAGQKVERITRIYLSTLTRIARALGPIED